MHSTPASQQSSRNSSPDSHKRHCSSDRHVTPERSKRSSHYRYKSSGDRDTGRDNYERRSVLNHHRQSTSRSRSNSPSRSDRWNVRRRHNSSRACDRHAENVAAGLKLITRDARYFLLKSNNFDNLLLAKAESVWSTPPPNEARINDAFRVRVCTWLNWNTASVSINISGWN